MEQAKDSSSLNWAEKFVIAVSAVTSTLLFSVLSPVLPKMQQVFAANPHAPILIKMVIAIVGVSMVIGCPFGGWLANRFNHRMILAVGFFIYAVAGGLGLIVSDLYVLLATRALIGFAAAVSSTVALITLSELVSGHQRNAWMGILVAVSFVVSVAAFPIAGFLGAISWRLPFAMYLVMLLPAGASLFMRDVRRTELKKEPSPRGSFTIPYQLVVLGFVNGLLGFLPTIYVPFHFHELGIEDPRMISAAFTVSTLMGALASSAYGLARRKLDIYLSLSIAYVVAAAGMAAVASSTTRTSALAGMFVFGLGQAWLAPNLFALAAQLSEDERSSGFGMAKGAMYFATLVGVVIFEPINRAFGANGVLIATGTSGLVMTAYILCDRMAFSDRTRERTAGVMRPES